MKTINWVLASLIATSSTVALAEEAPTTAVETQTEVTTSEQPAEKKVFNKLDVDQDGKISQEEAKNYPKLVEGFDKIDADSDGFLSPEEFTRPHKKS